MRLKRIYLLSALLVLATGCGKRYKIVIDNSCIADTIFVQYRNLDDNDTVNLQINPQDAEIIFDSNPSNGQLSFLADYTAHIQINYIVNTSGDSVSFDPNHQSNWGGSTGQHYYDWRLEINDSSF